MEDPTESNLAAKTPMLLDYLRTGQFGQLKGQAGVPLRFALYGPPEGTPVRGVINLFGGRNESIAKYAEVLFNLRDLRAQGYVVALMDHRGQGFSGRELDQDKGHVSHFDDYIADEQTFTTFLKKEYGDRVPFDAMAHSMGGAIAMRLFEKHPGTYRKAVLLSPMLAIDPHMPGWIASTVGRIAGTLLPSNYALSKGPYKAVGAQNSLTSSAARAEFMNDMVEIFPDSRLGGPTWRWMRESMRADRELFKKDELAKIGSTQIQVWSARADTVVKPSAEDGLAKDLGIPLRKFEGMKHELLMAPDSTRNEVLKDLRAVFTAGA
jgi:lysophospholipase